jgi:hypothetical protein
MVQEKLLIEVRREERTLLRTETNGLTKRKITNLQRDYKVIK